MSDAILAWHWLRADRRLNYPPHSPVEPGVTLKIDGRPTLCERGLHASRRAIDALCYAPGPIICRVRVGGQVVEGNDKLVSTERTILAWADATNTLHEFACCCAEDALRTAKVEDARCWNAIETKRRWLKGEAGDADLDAARAAAWAAARDADLDAARAAAWAAARDAARDAQNRRLESMLFELLGIAE